MDSLNYSFLALQHLSINGLELSFVSFSGQILLQLWIGIKFSSMDSVDYFSLSLHLLLN